jgi:DNA-directed RNA polymerase
MIDFSVSQDSLRRRSVLYQPAKISNKTSKVQRISTLESEHQHNQNRIRQLHRRNQELSQEIRHLSQNQIAQKRKNSATSAPKPKSSQSLRRIIQNLRSQLQKIHLGQYSMLFWLQAVVMLVGVGLVCGSAGFMLVRLIVSFIG